MIYVLSDIHGQKRRFESIMNQINLQPEDTLYVLGDVIDRYPHGIQILRKLMAMPNVKMLLGNHEHMMLNAIYYPAPERLSKWEEDPAKRRLRIWYNNGGDITHEYLKHIRKTIRTDIFEYLDSLPTNYELDVNGRKFILTHAAPACEYPKFAYRYDSERDFCVWHRYQEFPLIEDATIVFGHTPTTHFSTKDPMCIWYKGNWIGIDCGCTYPEGGDAWTGVHGRLGCLRLDDMAEFYSEEYESREEFVNAYVRSHK